MLGYKSIFAFWMTSCFWDLVASSQVKTKVAILGGGMAGIIAARTLQEHGVEDFVIVEAREELGGRMQNAALGNGIKVEFGANWIHGLDSGFTENPIYAMALKHKLANVPTNYTNIATFNHKGSISMEEERRKLEDAWATYLAEAGTRIASQGADLTARVGLSLSGYRPRTYIDDVAEYYGFDFKYGQPPEESSFIASAINNNATCIGSEERDNLVTDQRGFKHIVQAEAHAFLNYTDSRILLNHVIVGINYTDSIVRIDVADGSTIEADYAICTFSIGVLQHDDVKFYPELPAWKREAIYGMNMGTYTKIFLRFNTTFWPNTQFQLYADPTKRGFYPVWQSLDAPGFLPGSHILFATVTGSEARRIHRQGDSKTKEEMMGVLRSMYGPDIPEPEEILFKRWRSDPLFRGSYSNWGTSYLPELFDHLRAPVESRLWFAGEGTSSKYYGFLQGAYYEGMQVAREVLRCLEGDCTRDLTEYLLKKNPSNQITLGNASLPFCFFAQY